MQPTPIAPSPPPGAPARIRASTRSHTQTRTHARTRAHKRTALPPSGRRAACPVSLHSRVASSTRRASRRCTSDSAPSFWPSRPPTSLMTQRRAAHRRPGG
eukprot:6185021-Pleurochrysis_carterae.AAC.2